MCVIPKLMFDTSLSRYILKKVLTHMQMLISNKDVLIAIMEVDSSKNKSISRLILTQG